MMQFLNCSFFEFVSFLLYSSSSSSEDNASDSSDDLVIDEVPRMKAQISDELKISAFQKSILLWVN